MHYKFPGCKNAQCFDEDILMISEGGLLPRGARGTVGLSKHFSNTRSTHNNFIHDHEHAYAAITIVSVHAHIPNSP